MSRKLSELPIEHQMVGAVLGGLLAAFLTNSVIVFIGGFLLALTLFAIDLLNERVNKK